LESCEEEGEKSEQFTRKTRGEKGSAAGRAGWQQEGFILREMRTRSSILDMEREGGRERGDLLTFSARKEETNKQRRIGFGVARPLLHRCATNARPGLHNPFIFLLAGVSLLF